MKQLDSLMDTTYVIKLNELSDFASKIASIEMMPRIVLPSEVYQNEELDSLYLQYNNSLNDLLKFVPFQAILNSTDEKSTITSIAKLAKSEPCELHQINNILQEIIRNKVSKGESFVFETLKYLSGYVCDQELALQILNNYNLPAYAFSFYILPQFAMKPGNKEFADAIWLKIQKFSANQRLIIYNNFVNLQQKQRTMIINSAKISRKLKFIFKRLSVENPTQYTEKFTKYFAKCPDKSLNMLLNHICEVSPLTSIPLNLCMNFSTVMSDFLILSLLESIENNKIKKSQENVSEWLVDVSMFISKIIRHVCDAKIISDFIDICKKGLNNSQTKYACLLTYFINETCGICYRGNMSQYDIDIKSSNNLERLLARANSKNNEEFVKISQKVTEKLNKEGLDLLICLDKMINSSLLSHDSIDNLRFLFITISDVSKINLEKTDKNFGFSLASSYHISRLVSKLSIDDINEVISKQKLSEIFWILSPFHLYVPKSVYSKSKEEIDKLTDETNKDFMPLLKSKLNLAEDEQKNMTEKVTNLLYHNSFDWFDNDEKYIDFTYKCLLPRTIFSNFDAFFCVEFVKKLREILDDFDVKKLLITILSKLHFVVFSSTFEESRNLGYLIANLLEMIEISRDLENLLMDKLNILLKREENFSIANTFVVYDKISKVFPSKADMRSDLVKKISKIITEKGSDTSLLKRVYIQHLSMPSNYMKDLLPPDRPSPPPEREISPVRYRDDRYRRNGEEHRILSRYDDPEFLPSDTKRRSQSVRFSDNGRSSPERSRYDSYSRKEHNSERNSSERVHDSPSNDKRKVFHAREEERRPSPKNTKDDDDGMLPSARKMAMRRSESQMVPTPQQIPPLQPPIPNPYLPPSFLPPPPPPSLLSKPPQHSLHPQRPIPPQSQMMIPPPPIPPSMMYSHPPIPPQMMFPHPPMPLTPPPPPPPHMIQRRPREDDPYLPPSGPSNRYR
ncbi:hypothetical protein TVAG_081070 [Trichomonas vaginalis G3]|uniref:THO complex subunitTHOC2 C-terminal domain-containing protein n=1 Tax=Trichomonas vaginalis (strain ATCC PRA-98 / G3) TaxID=412133 RepID=A2EPD0_TRIV3|nr:mRNA transport [Trichomonas vaginalis G3]EAY05515.1 hypothetical protein TVAG_081070 [Trichomonas vaginalis G3]KAI5507827.1 mRNA transport [Trichomonas vaginalis G3]|eukprot:XP_001317738.1 hypothetical protein [Trichomonas vaginalis G3]